MYNVQYVFFLGIITAANKLPTVTDTLKIISVLQGRLELDGVRGLLCPFSFPLYVTSTILQKYIA
jgi:hypothetical protein